MMFCKVCNITIVDVMSFSKDKNDRFSRCPRCYSETKHQRIKDDDVDFGELKIIHKGRFQQWK